MWFWRPSTWGKQSDWHGLITERYQLLTYCLKQIWLVFMNCPPWLSKQPSIINTKSTKVFMLMFRLRGKQWSDPICVLASTYRNPGIKKIFIYCQVPSKSTHCHEDYVMMSTLNTVNLGSSCWYVLNWSVAKICDKETFI